jgi:hypothetical protein
MKEKNLYYPVWQKYLPVITIQMKNAVNGIKEIKMSKSEFEFLGNRKVSDYLINLEINKSKIANNITGSAVARDLFEILSENKICKDLLSERYYKFSMGKDFILRISIQ